jgi:hypothetical protein
MSTSVPAAGLGRAAQRETTWTRSIRTVVPALWINLLILLAAGTAVVVAGFFAHGAWPDRNTWGGGALKVFVVWCLSFLPGWLYVRFRHLRMESLWQEYVLTLHRLGWDRPEHLPEPPRNSDFHAYWERGNRGEAENSIYREKFQAYYGDYEPGSGRPVSAESLFPVFLATAVFAVGWVTVLWDTGFLTGPIGTWDALKYGFIGAYAFVTGMLVRRYFQADLRPSAYTSSVMRIVLVLLIVAVLHQVLGPLELVWAELATAFVVGFFPLAGLAALHRSAAKALGGYVPPLSSPYPLDRLDGLNLWYEARLLEEGVEDMQNLSTMNLVDVVLHTRVPPGRLVDWLDQALLLLHLHFPLPERKKGTTPPAAPPGASLDGPEAQVALRRAGVRTATDLLNVYAPAGKLVALDDACLPLPRHQLRSLVTVLQKEPRLRVVWNWKGSDVPAYPGRAGQAPDPSPDTRP